jgi:hypothetical protein
MKQVMNDLYWEALREIEKIHKGKLLLSERVALEKAMTKLDAMRKILNYYNFPTA